MKCYPAHGTTGGSTSVVDTTHTIVICASAILLLVLSACGGSRHEATEKYYMVSAIVQNGYWQTAQAGLTAGAKALSVPWEVAGPDNYDPKAEVEAFRGVVAKKPTGILVSVGDPNLMKDPIDAAIAQGIPVITIDADAPGSKRLAFVGTNNYQAGLMGGRTLAERMQGKGNVVVFTMPGQANLEERLQGYKNILANHPGIKIADVVDIKGDPAKVFDATSQMIAGKNPPDGYICLVSFACQEVADVLDRKQVTGKVLIGMDTDPNTLTWIKKGAIAATIAQKPFTMAHFGIAMLDIVHHYNLPKLDLDWSKDTRAPLPTFVDTGATLIDKSNVDAFMAAQPAAPAAK
ncbi:MAG TPA: substrate-binding domain-containing protein [Bryobacteraceae bacterium]|nr:substrate-binding domain-containing protein [Bryobacteraceae bacterium]